jgi:hypothetical protein
VAPPQLRALSVGRIKKCCWQLAAAVAVSYCKLQSQPREASDLLEQCQDGNMLIKMLGHIIE